MKYFSIDETVEMLMTGQVTRMQIRAMRNTNRNNGYSERADFFNEVLQRFDQTRKAQKEA